MKTRILSAAIGISVAIGLLILGAYFPIVIDICLAAIAIMCLFEGLSAKKLEKKLTIMIPCTAFTVLFLLFYSVPYACMIIVFLFIVSLFMAMVFNHEKLVFHDLSFAFTITMLCTLGIWTIVYLYDMRKDIEGIFYVIAALAIPWFADAGAYFGGSFLGKHKLCPKISPKKTIEGAVTGVIVGAVIPLVEGVVFTQFFFHGAFRVNYINFMIIGLCVSVISILGDLSFSLIKRSCNIKDYGSLIPGHGGMLDRFDSVIFSTPLLLILHYVLPLVEKV